MHVFIIRTGDLLYAVCLANESEAPEVAERLRAYTIALDYQLSHHVADPVADVLAWLDVDLRQLRADEEKGDPR